MNQSMAFIGRAMQLCVPYSEENNFREYPIPVSLDALREIFLNTVMHRDYSQYSGHVAIVVFGDRIEIRSFGRLPNGVMVKQLSGKHISKPTNPLIAGAFHRTGAVEIWGRGTNRVIEICKKHGVALPTFEEMQGFVIVTFKAIMVPHVPDEDSTASGAQSIQVLSVLSRGPFSAGALANVLGMQSKTGALKRTLGNLLADALIEFTLPDKSNSRLQKYRLTEKGSQTIQKHKGDRQ
jgi:ATP-dependent DNA helicase RecG